MSKSNPLTPEQAKKRQKLILGGVLVAVMGGSFAGIALTSKKTAPAQQKQDIKRTTITVPGSQLDSKDVWTARSATQLSSMESQISQTSDANKILGDRLAALEKAQKDGNPLPGDALPGGKATPATPSGAKLPPPPPLPSSKSLPPLPKASSASLQLPPPPISGKDGKPGLPDLGAPDFKPRGIIMETMDDGPSEKDKVANAAKPAAMHTAGSTVTASNVPVAGYHSVTNYIPSGSFVRAVVLGGIDAPTGGQAQSNPQPVLLRLTSNAILPNRFRSQVKECFVVGAGFGDISSERAYIRTESLSCVLKNGQAVDVPVKGYIADETGKAGMKGRLVTKQGQILANALISGLASGFGDILQQRSTTTSISPLGATSTITPGQEVNAGIGAGVGKALDRLSQYYISLADKIFPVIEVDAGRTVDVVFTKGIELQHEATNTSDDGGYIEWVRRQQRHGY